MSGSERRQLLYFVGITPIAESGILLPSGEPLTGNYLNELPEAELDLLAHFISLGRGGIGLEGFETDPRLKPANQGV